MDRGLSEGSVNTVFGRVEQQLKNDKAEKRGDNVMDYDIIHKGLIDKLIEKQRKANWYGVCYGGSSVKPDGIQKNFHKENEKRIIKGETPYVGIILNVKFTSEKIRDKDWPKIKEGIKYLLAVGEWKTTIHFNELEMYINGLINVDTILAK